MKNLFKYVIVLVLFSSNVFAETKLSLKGEQAIKKIANAAYESKLCIMSISSSLNSYKYPLLRAHEELATELVTRIKNNTNKKWVPDAVSPSGYVNKFGRLHGRANDYAMRSCSTFPYSYVTNY